MMKIKAKCKHKIGDVIVWNEKVGRFFLKITGTVSGIDVFVRNGKTSIGYIVTYGDLMGEYSIKEEDIIDVKSRTSIWKKIFRR